MTKNDRPYDSNGLMISYKQLGTINIDELAHAVIEDIQALKDTYNVRYVTGARLKLFTTDEYGRRVEVRRPAGGIIRYMDTLHYRPACRDYDL